MVALEALAVTGVAHAKATAGTLGERLRALLIDKHARTSVTLGESF